MSYRVQFDVPRRELGAEDVYFNVRRNKRAFGTLKVSKGAIVWVPGNNKKYEYRMNWTQFDRAARAATQKKIPWTGS